MSRIRTNLITNRMANGAPTVSHGLVVAGVTTITGSINNLNLTGITTISTLDLNGDLDVDGHLNADNVSIAGVVTATTFYGSGANLTGIDATKIITGNTQVQTIDTGSDGHVKITTEGSERARITSAGKFLIGTSTPQGNANADDLVVSTSGHSGITIRSGTSSNGNIFFADGTSGGDEYRGVIDYNHSSNHMSFSTNAVERIRILSNGNVLIGTSVDGNQALNVYGAANAAVAIQNSNTGTGANNGIYIGNGNSTIAYIWNYENDSMRFATNNIERLRIDAGGGLQLGTSTATASKLTVYGASDAAAIFQGSSTGTGAGNGLLVGNNGGTTGLLWNYENGPVKIAAHNAEHVRIATDGSCYFGPRIITEADMNWGHDAHQRPYVFSGNQSGVNPADATIVVANPNTDPPSTRLGSFMFGCKTSSGGNSGIKAYIEGWTTSNPSNTYEAGGYIKFVTRQSAGSLTDHFKIDHDGKLYKSGNHFYPLVNYTEVTTFTAVSTSSNSYTDLRTILSGYTPKKAGNLIVIHHQSQCWQGGHANDSGDAMWKIQRQEGGGSWTDVTENDRIMGNMDGRNYTGGSGLARHHRTVHLMGSFTCNGSSFNLKSLGKVDFTSVGLQWYHHSFNILQVWEYEKG